MRTKSLLLAAVVVMLVAGCSQGIIYTHTFQPLTTDLHRTPVSAVSQEGDIKHLQIPGTAFGIAWDSAGIGDIAKKHGMHEVYFADLETFRVLLVWNRYTVHVYGK